MVTKKSKRFIKALQSFCMIDNIVIEKKLKREGVLNKRRGMCQDGIPREKQFFHESGTLSVAAGDDALEAEALVRISGGSVFLDAEDYLIHCDGEQELTRGCVFYEKQ